jgi:hypothetical protein
MNLYMKAIDKQGNESLVRSLDFESCRAIIGDNITVDLSVIEIALASNLEDAEGEDIFEYSVLQQGDSLFVVKLKQGCFSVFDYHTNEFITELKYFLEAPTRIIGNIWNVHS